MGNAIEEAEKERQEKREKMEQLTTGLLAYDSKSLGDVVKCYITEEKDTDKLTDTAYEAYRDIAEILVLEWEC